MYWDKFVKKKVKTKYQEQFDLQQLSRLLGLNAQQDEYKFGQVNKANGKNKLNESEEPVGFFSKYVITTLSEYFEVFILLFEIF